MREDPLVEFRLQCPTHKVGQLVQISQSLVTDDTVDILGYLGRSAAIARGNSKWCDATCNWMLSEEKAS